jgi:hypothetical protein
MSDPLDEFNRRMTAGQGSWRMGPPTNPAESAAQSLIDAQAREAGQAAGGGGITISLRLSSGILLVGIALFSWCVHATRGFLDTPTAVEMILVVVSGLVLLAGGIGLVGGCLQSLGSAGTWRNIGLAALAAAVTWWMSRWLWMMSYGLVPQGLLPIAAIALVFLVIGTRR